MKTAFILKKMAAIVAIVRAGLLASLLEQAEASHGNSATPATVSYVDLVGFLNPAQQPSVVIEFPDSEFGSWWGAKIDVTSDVSTMELYQGVYLIIFHYPYYPTPFAASKPFFEDGDGWVEVWIWTAIWMGTPTFFNAPATRA